MRHRPVRAASAAQVPQVVEGGPRHRGDRGAWRRGLSSACRRFGRRARRRACRVVVAATRVRLARTARGVSRRRPDTVDRAGCESSATQVEWRRARRGAGNRTVGGASKSKLARQTERVASGARRLRAMQRERDASRKEATALHAEVEELQVAQVRLEQTMTRRDDDRRRLRDRVRELEEKALAPVERGENRELQRLARAVAASARAAAADADALDRELGERLGREPKPPAAPGRLARRRPARMPSGIVDDSVAGAEHLVSRPGAVLLVDGYNATLSSWPELTLEHQRDRLLALVNDLTARVSRPRGVSDLRRRGSRRHTGPPPAQPRPRALFPR